MFASSIISNDGRRHIPKIKRYYASTVDGCKYTYKLKEIEPLKGFFGRRVNGVRVRVSAGAGKKVPASIEVYIDIDGKRWPKTTTTNTNLPKSVAMAKVKHFVGPDVSGLVNLVGVNDGIVWCVERF